MIVCLAPRGGVDSNTFESESYKQALRELNLALTGPRVRPPTSLAFMIHNRIGQGASQEEIINEASRVIEKYPIDWTAETEVGVKYHPKFYTALHVACQRGFGQLAEYLIAQGADVNGLGGKEKPKQKKISPLYLAALSNSRRTVDQSQALVNLLIERGATLCAEDINSIIHDINWSQETLKSANLAISRLHNGARLSPTIDQAEKDELLRSIWSNISWLINRQDPRYGTPIKQNLLPEQILDLDDLVVGKDIVQLSRFIDGLGIDNMDAFTKNELQEKLSLFMGLIKIISR